MNARYARKLVVTSELGKPPADLSKKVRDDRTLPNLHHTTFQACRMTQPNLNPLLRDITKNGQVHTKLEAT